MDSFACGDAPHLSSERPARQFPAAAGRTTGAGDGRRGRSGPRRPPRAPGPPWEERPERRVSRRPPDD